MRLIPSTAAGTAAMTTAVTQRYLLELDRCRGAAEQLAAVSYRCHAAAKATAARQRFQLSSASSVRFASKPPSIIISYFQTLSRLQEVFALGLEQSIKKKNFENFDLVEDYSDHHYAKNKSQNCFTDTGSCVYNKILREWKILSNALPDSIFVRAYEKRIDLLRAVIIGAQGTLYHDALFFFDIAIPSDYPENPPQVSYMSHGPKLNPYLFPSGDVCLNLLDGKGNEIWNPAASTILQVLVSIQGLVLDAKPYYSENLNTPASYWQSRIEDKFELSCRTMLSQLQKPPKNFKSFVVQHFQDRAFTILRACKAYRDNRVRIGLFSYYGPSSSPENYKIKVSRTFRDSMNKLIPQLSKEFSRNGTSLQNGLKKPENVERKKTIEPKIGLKTKNVPLFHKVLGKLGLCLGLKNDSQILNERNGT